MLCGLSAGSLCCFDEVVTAFHGEPRIVGGLGLLPHSNCVHYDCPRGRARAFRVAPTLSGEVVAAALPVDVLGEPEPLVAAAS